jgi:DNA-directed RNA polymerase specialized sigma subunit
MTNEDEMTNRKLIPVDERKVDESDSAAGEYVEASKLGREIREKILANPLGRESYERAVAEIESHQANLAQVRKLRSLAQSTVAELMDMDQSEISRLERRTDLLLSTLRKFIQATGGDLHLIAHFPEGNVELLIGNEFSEEVSETSDVNA